MSTKDEIKKTNVKTNVKTNKKTNVKTNKPNVKTNNNKKIKTKKNYDKYKCKDLYKPFEKRVEEEFRKNDMDLSSINYNLEEQILKQLELVVSPSNVKPEDDFYSYINDRWLIDKEKESTSLIQLDNFRIVQSNINKKLVQIFNEYSKKHETKEALNMKQLIKSTKTFSTNMQSINNCTDFLNKYAEYSKKPDNYFKFLAYLNKNPIIAWSAPIVWGVQTDDYNPEYLISAFNSPKFTLTNYEMYFPELVKKNKQYQKFIDYYLEYLDKLFTNVFGANHGFDVNDVYACESDMMAQFGCSDHKNEEYNVVKLEDLDKYSFNYKDFLSELGYEKYPEKIVVSNLNYFNCINKLLKENWIKKKWKTYFLYMVLRNEQRFNITGHQITYDFQYKYLKGGLKNPDKSEAAVYVFTYCYNNFLNNKYIEHANDALIISYVTSLALDLKEVYTRIIQRNNWLETETKVKALNKLKNYRLEIGSKMIEALDPFVEFEETNPYKNLEKMGNKLIKRLISLVGSKLQVPSTLDWSQFPPKYTGNSSFIVNAFYTPNKNRIDVPLGYLQFPFVSLKQRGIEYNLAHVGFTIAHEMSHALDNTGSKYDASGKRLNWWTKKDAEHFKKIQENVIEQYEKFASYDNFKFDASLSIGENMADISAVAICIEYLRDFQLLNKYILPIQSISFKTFFIYYAYHQRQIVNNKAIHAQMLTNPHPLEKYRTNVPLSRIEIFRKLYRISKKDKMWWKTSDKIWS